MNFNKIKENILVLNLILMILGYEIATSFFMPLLGGAENMSTQLVTIPYRAFALGISLLSIGIGIQRWQKSPRFNSNVIFFLIFIFLYGLRIIYDNANGIDIGGMTSKINQFYFLISIPYAISMILTYDSINYKKAFYGLIFLGTIAIFLSFIFAQEDLSENARMDGNVALNTISYGHLGLTVFILTLFTIIKLNLTKFIKILLFVILLLALYTTLRAGSRGPMVSLLCIGGFWVASYYKNLFISIFPLVLLFILLVLFSEQILDLVHSISPVAAKRFQALLEGSASGREDGYLNTLSFILKECPITGVGYFIGGTYPHNIILDGLIAFGVGGAIAISIILYNATMIAYKAMVLNLENAWIGLLMLQGVLASMFSGSFAMNTKLSGLIMLCFLLYNDVYIRKNARQMPLPPLRPNFNRNPINLRRNQPHY